MLINFNQFYFYGRSRCKFYIGKSILNPPLGLMVVGKRGYVTWTRSRRLTLYMVSPPPPTTHTHTHFLHKHSHTCKQSRIFTRHVQHTYKHIYCYFPPAVPPSLGKVLPVLAGLPPPLPVMADSAHVLYSFGHDADLQASGAGITSSTVSPLPASYFFIVPADLESLLT